MPGSRTSERRSSCGSAPGSITTSSRVDRLGQRDERPPAPGRHGEGTRVTPGQPGERRRGREEVGERCRRVAAAARPAARTSRPATVRAPDDRDLLADDGAHGQLEAVGGAGHTPARIARDDGPRRASPRRASQTATGSASRSSSCRQRDDGGGQVAQVGEHQLALHVGRVGGGPGRRRRRRAEGDDGMAVGQAQACAGRTRPSSDSTPGSARTPRNSSTDAGLNGRRHGSRRRIAWGAPLSAPPAAWPAGPSGRSCPQPARRVGEDLAHRVVALAHAGEAGGEGDVGDGQVGRLEQDARRLAALRPRQGERSRADLRGDQTVQLARAVAEAPRPGPRRPRGRRRRRG